MKSTLCDPMDCSVPGFSVHGIFQAIVLEWIAISFSRDLPNSGLEPGLPHCRQTLYHLSHQGSPQINSPSPLKVCCSWYYYSYLSYCMISLYWFMSCNICPLNSWSWALNLIVTTLRIKIFFSENCKVWTKYWLWSAHVAFTRASEEVRSLQCLQSCWLG